MTRGGATGTKVLMATTALALLLAGCTSGDPAPVPVAPVATTTSAEPSPTPTSSPTAPAPTKPVPPADLSRTDEVGAAAAAIYFVSLYPSILQSGDFTEWDRLSWPECSFCTETRTYVSGVKTSGGTFEGGAVLATLVKVHPLDDLIGGYPVDVDLNQEATVQRDSSGQVIDASAAELIKSRVDVLHTDTGWKVLAISDRIEVS